MKQARTNQHSPLNQKNQTSTQRASAINPRPRASPVIPKRASARGPFTNSQPKHNHSFSRSILLLGTRIGKCDICRMTTKVLLLKYGFTLCENCVNVCASILGDLEKNQLPTVVHKTTASKRQKIPAPRHNTQSSLISSPENSLFRPRPSEA